jgi:hypothetical protein
VHPAQELQSSASVDAEQEEFRKACRKNWARLIKKVFEVDPLVCANCGTPMHIVSFIEDPRVIETILVHLRLWEVPQRPPPFVAPQREPSIYDDGFFDGLVS